MLKAKNEKPVGLLSKRAIVKGMHKRYLPCNKLSYFIEHFWYVSWAYKEGEQHSESLLPHPSIHIVFENKKAKIIGIKDGMFTKKMQGSGWVLGIKFKPGAFHSFYKKPVSSIRNKELDLSALFPKTHLNLAESVFDDTALNNKIGTIETFLLKNIPKKDPKIKIIDLIIQKTKDEKSIIKVDDICKSFNISKRNLQRLFAKYVGVSPKWIINRYRMHELIEQLKEKPELNLSELSYDLGYYDQSHFINDFKKFVGVSPNDYIKTIL